MKSTNMGGADRRLKVRVKASRSRTEASRKWLERQLNDPYVARAKREGMRSRSAYKLIEINEKHHILKPGQRLVDLGAAPGGWCQVAAEIIGPKGRIVAIDLLQMEPLSGVEFAVMDFMDADAPKRLKEILGGPADGVLSDMAANTTGHKKTDHLRVIGLAEAAAEFAREVLSPGGFFLTKLFQGGETAELVTSLKRDFAQVRHVKPAASRSDSSELYLLATGYRGG